ncbi:MAG: hypothetical protein E6357_23625 [Clostridiales bacterium]|nr:hypothetical protein [Clostridiales bacterium]
MFAPNSGYVARYAPFIRFARDLKERARI